MGKTSGAEEIFQPIPVENSSRPNIFQTELPNNSQQEE
jgi:hypothetical protein